MAHGALNYNALAWSYHIVFISQVHNKGGNILKTNPISFSITILFCLVFSVGIYWLNRPTESDVPTAASKLIFVKAHVSELLTDNASPDIWTEGLRLGTQEIVAIIDSGHYKGRELYAVNYLNAYQNIDLKEGMKIIVRLDDDDPENPTIASIANYDRSTLLLSLGTVFVVLLLVLGGKKGLMAILGLFFTVFSIWFLLIPMAMKGFPVIPSAVLLVSITTIVSLVLLNGPSKKTFCAVAGCVGGVSIAGFAAYIAGIITPLGGFNMIEAEELVLRASDSGLEIRGLLVSGILIAALGAVMDIALTITSAVFELHQLSPKASRKALFNSGLNIGRDAMGTMANTLILAFAGASLNTLILFRVYDYPYLQIFNSDMMTVEIVQGLAGSIGIVLTVPLVAVLSAALFGQKNA
jgi:uncharacterized membrane protein